MNSIGSLFSAGNPIIMALLTVLLLVSLYLFSTRWFSKTKASLSKIDIKDVGLLALVIGIAAQLSGLYAMFDALQGIESASPAMIYGGLKVSLIAPIYGLIVFAISLSLNHCLTIRE